MSCSSEDTITYTYQAEYIDLPKTSDGDALFYEPIPVVSSKGICLPYLRCFPVFDTAGVMLYQTNGAPGYVLCHEELEPAIYAISDEFQAVQTAEDKTALAGGAVSASQIRAVRESTVILKSFTIQEGTAGARVAAVCGEFVAQSEDVMALMDHIILWDEHGNRLFTLPTDALGQKNIVGLTAEIALFFDGEGTLCAISEGTLFTFSDSGETKSTVQLCTQMPYTYNFSILYDTAGEAYIGWYTDQETKIVQVMEHNGRADVKEALSLSYPASTQTGAKLTFDRDGVLYCWEQNGIYICKEQEKQSEVLLRWASASISGSQVLNCKITDAETIAVVLADVFGGADMKLAILHRVEGEAIPDDHILYVACNSNMDPEQRRRMEHAVQHFGESHSGYAVQLLYYDYLSAQIATKIGQDILLARHPMDLITFDSFLTMDDFLTPQWLSDWNPYLDADTEFGRGAFLPCVLKPYTKEDGTLPVLTTEFSLLTLIGKESAVGTHSDWTYEKMTAYANEADKEHPVLRYSCTTPPDLPALAVFENLFAASFNEFVNLDTGNCSFDCADFYALLSLCEALPVEFTRVPMISSMDEWQDYYMEKNTLLNMSSDFLPIDSVREQATVKAVDDIINIRCYKFPGEATAWVGYPHGAQASKTGAAIVPYFQFGLLSTSQKGDLAWEFVKTYLLEQLNYTVKSAAMLPYIPCTYAALEQHLDDAAPYRYQYRGFVTRSQNQGDGRLTEIDRAVLRMLCETTTRRAVYCRAVEEIVYNEVAAYYAGRQTQTDTAAFIENRLRLLLAER